MLSLFIDSSDQVFAFDGAKKEKEPLIGFQSAYCRKGRDVTVARYTLDAMKSDVEVLVAQGTIG